MYQRPVFKRSKIIEIVKRVHKIFYQSLTIYNETIPRAFSKKLAKDFIKPVG